MQNVEQAVTLPKAIFRQSKKKGMCQTFEAGIQLLKQVQRIGPPKKRIEKTTGLI